MKLVDRLQAYGTRVNIGTKGGSKFYIFPVPGKKGGVVVVVVVVLVLMGG